LEEEKNHLEVKKVNKVGDNVSLTINPEKLA
jgi:hypothetical protein